MQLNLMTYNIFDGRNYYGKQFDLESYARAIRDCNVDIVGLNEVWNSGDDVMKEEQVKRLSELTGLEYYRFAEAIKFDCGDYGNGFLSKVPIVKSEIHIIPDPEIKTGKNYYMTRCVFKAVLNNGLTVLVTHLGLNRDEHLSGVKTILNNLALSKCVLMGDLNVQPDSDILTDIRARMTDAADYFGNRLMSFPSDKPDSKYDYIFVSPDVKVVSADIPAIAVSDHRPHTAVIEF